MTFNPETFRELAGKITKGPIAESDKATAQYFAYCFTHAQEIAALAEENARLREALTPSGDTKAAYHGEFTFNVEYSDEDGGSYWQTQLIPWTVVKEIMAAISARAALERKPHD